ncbi:MAG: PEGA domain-containing protein [bacterium]|nr:PEGA domain-containing protein [bacterium]
MSTNKTNKKEGRHIQNWAGIIYTICSALIILAGTFIAVRWAKGDFRLDESNQAISKETGLLHATSIPQGAQVYINGNLTSATDDIIYLSPGEYEVRIQKDGYSPWQKTIKIEQSLVSQANAMLYPYSPSLTALTFTGASNISVSPDGQKLLYYNNNISTKNKNGLYLLDLTNSSKSPTQISDNDSDFTLAEAQYIWSPDSSEILVFTPERTFLLKVNTMTNLQSSPDMTLQLKTLLQSWEEDILAKEKQYLEKIPLAAMQTIIDNGTDFNLSPDTQKLLYIATGSATLADGLVPPLPASNSYPEQRTLKPGNIFLYDSYEDKNFNLGAAATSSAKLLLADINTLELTAHNIMPMQTLISDDEEETIANFNRYYGDYRNQTWQWLADSTHLVGIQNGSVVIMNYDGSNPTVIYSGPLADSFVLPYPDGNKILILTSFNPDSPANVYAIELKK